MQREVWEVHGGGTVKFIGCPRVALRLECKPCGYSASEALYTVAENPTLHAAVLHVEIGEDADKLWNYASFLNVKNGSTSMEKCCLKANPCYECR